MKVKLTWRLVAALLLGLVGYYIVFQAFYNQIAFKTVFPYDNFADMMVGVFYNFTPTFLQSVFITAVIFRPTKIQHIGLKIAIDALLVIVMLIIFNFAYTRLMDAHVDWGGSAFNAIFVFLGVETTFYVLNFKSSMREAETQKQMALQYRYDALKAQVNPHFLFNSLNILYSLIDIDQQKSREFVMSLSQMYRYIMSQQNRDTVPLRDEMGFLHNYVDILMKRYRDQLTVDISGEDKIANQQLVPYTLQLLIENVTKHNTITALSPMTVKINITPQEITITNPIFPRKANSIGKIGLRYITQLYASHHKKFSIDNDGEHFTAHVPYL